MKNSWSLFIFIVGLNGASVGAQPSTAVSDWLQTNPQYQEIMSGPEGLSKEALKVIVETYKGYVDFRKIQFQPKKGANPQDELFQNLFEFMREFHRLALSQGELPHKSLEGHFQFLLNAAAENAFPRTEAELSKIRDPRQWQARVDFYSSQGPLTEEEKTSIRLGQAFVLAAIGAGMMEAPTLVKLAQRIETVELRPESAELYSEMDMRKGRRSPKRIKVSEVFPSLYPLGLSLIERGNDLNPFWQYWTSFDFRVLQSDAKSLLDLLVAQRVTGRSEELRKAQRQALSEDLLRAMDWSPIEKRLGVSLNGTRSSIVDVIITDVPKGPRSLSQRLMEHPELKNLRFNDSNTKPIYDTALRLLPRLAAEKRAESLAVGLADRQAQLRRLEADRAIDVLRAQLREVHIPGAEFQQPEFDAEGDEIEISKTESFLKPHTEQILKILNRWLTDGKISSPPKAWRDPLELESYLISSLTVVAQEDLSLIEHRRDVEARAAARLRRSLTDSEKSQISEFQVRILASRLVRKHDNTLDLLPSLPEALVASIRGLGLLPEVGTAHWSADLWKYWSMVEHETSAHRADSLTRRLKRQAMTTHKLDESGLAFNLWRRGVEAEGVDESTLKKVLRVVVHKAPESPEELVELLINRKFMSNTLQLDPIKLSLSQATEILLQSQHAMGALGPRFSCKDILKTLP